MSHVRCAKFVATASASQTSIKVGYAGQGRNRSRGRGACGELGALIGALLFVNGRACLTIGTFSIR